MMGTVSLRRMSPQDVDDVAAMENSIFTDAWHRDAFARKVSGRNSMPWVAVSEEGDLLGYMIAWFVVDEAHLGNIAVAPAARRKGIAQRLLNELVTAAHKRETTGILLEVRASNEVAKNLYGRNGFETISVRKRYYENKEDALVMKKSLTKPPLKDN